MGPSIQTFKTLALKQKKIKDGVVDEHALLLFIEHNAEREKLSRRGECIPNTRLGAVSFPVYICPAACRS